MTRIHAFWRELKQRGVVTAVVVYAVIGFIVLLLADLLAGPLALPVWAHRLLVRTALAGLPITIVVAWSFDLRRQIRPVGGRDLDAIQEEEHARTTSIWKITATVVAVLLLSLSAGAFFTSRESAPAVDAKRVVIASFENRTDNSELDGIGALAADWIAQRLIETRQVEAVPFSATAAYNTVAPASPTTPAFSRAIELARGVGAGLVVWGAYYIDHDSLKFAAHLMDSRTGDLLRNIRTTSAPAYQTSDIIARFRENVAAAIARQLETRLPAWPDTLASPPTPRAHERFVAGIQQYADRDFDSAAVQFREAAAIDSTFANARIWEMRALADAGRCDVADTVAQSLEADRVRITSYDAALLDHVQASCTHNPEARYAASTKMLRYAPASDDAARLLAIDALAVAHPREARSTLLAAHPDHGWMRAWDGGYFATLAMAYDYVLDFRDELRVAEEGVRRYPSSAESWLGICRALAGLHRINEANAAALLLQTRFDYGNQMTPGTAFFYCAQEMASHGERDGARIYIGRSYAWFKAYSDRSLSASARADYANVLALLHRDADAYRMMAGIAREPLAPAQARLMRARLAFIASITGHARETRSIDAQLDSLPESQLTYDIQLEQARTSAVLGQRDRAWNKLIQALDNGLPYAETGRAGLNADYALAPLRKLQMFARLVRPRG